MSIPLLKSKDGQGAHQDRQQAKDRPRAQHLQRTLEQSGSFSGVALHTGAEVTLTLKPAPVNHGIQFKRLDLPDEPVIAAKVENVKTVERATTIGEGHIKVHTVEHVLSALAGLGVDNAVVEMNANEPPIGDGSAAPYVALIKQCGIVDQDAPRHYFEVQEPLYIELPDTGSILSLLPDSQFRVSCTQVGPKGRFTQFESFEITPEVYEREIAPARTFTYYEDIEPLIEKGLIKGGRLENAIVIRDEAVLSKEPLRFTNEFARHKILDIVGDLALSGCFIKGHLIAIKPGHRVNSEMSHLIRKAITQLTQAAAPATTSTPAVELSTLSDINEVMRLLPHRYPFLMVDRIISVANENQCTALKQVTINEPYFKGHFPDYPVMPGVLQVEAMAQVASIIILRQAENAGKKGFFMSADEVKFRKPVLPGDTLLIHAEIVKFRRNIVRAKCHCTVNDITVSEADVTLSIFEN